MIRCLMMDEEWAIIEPFLTPPFVAWRAAARQSPAGGGRYIMDLPHRRTFARPAGGVRQLEFGLAGPCRSERWV